MKLIERIKAWFVREFDVPESATSGSAITLEYEVGDKVLTRGQYSFGPQVGIVSKVYAPGIFAVRLPHCQSGPVDFPGRAGWTFVASELTPIL